MPASVDAKALPTSAETPLSVVFDETAGGGGVVPRPASGLEAWTDPPTGTGAPAAHAAQLKQANHPARRSTGASARLARGLRVRRGIRSAIRTRPPVGVKPGDDRRERDHGQERAERICA